VTQILGNLVINSGKFTDRGGHVTLELQPLDLNFVAIQVTDNGMGMDADLIQRVFLPFEQADRSLHRSGGLGLGLALVKSLTELHGGQVSASSPGLGLGSRFVLTLPTIPVPETEGSLRPAANPQARPHSILVIEDNRDAALTLKMLLEVFGHQVDTAPSGRQGLERARTGQPEVVFCDIGLPDMDGYAVATALRLDPKFSASLLVAMTGYGQEEDIRRALEAGFDQHLTKPVALEALEHLLAF